MSCSLKICNIHDNALAKALDHYYYRHFDFLPLFKEDFKFNFSQIFTSLKLYAKRMFQSCQLKVKVTVEGQYLNIGFHLCTITIMFLLNLLNWFPGSGVVLDCIDS